MPSVLSHDLCVRPIKTGDHVSAGPDVMHHNDDGGDGGRADCARGRSAAVETSCTPRTAEERRSRPLADARSGGERSRAADERIPPGFKSAGGGGGGRSRARRHHVVAH